MALNLCFYILAVCTQISFIMYLEHTCLKSIPNGHTHSQTYGRVNARVHEKVLVLFQESLNVTTIFLQLRHFLLDVSQEVRVGLIKSKLSYLASTCCCDLLSQLN